MAAGLAIMFRLRFGGSMKVALFWMLTEDRISTYDSYIIILDFKPV
jgi:hypothetical protein